jgi:hypothetical protein
MVKENSNEMHGHEDAGTPDSSDQPESKVAFLLIKIQHQLSRLERQMESIVSMMQERRYGGSASHDKPFRKKPFVGASRASGRFDSRRIEKRNEKPGEKDADQKFYSRFSKQNGRSGPGKKPFQRKPQKRR